MSWTRDHLSQCKFGRLKDGGKNGCRRDKPPMKKVTKGLTISKYVYIDRRYLGGHPHEKRYVTKMFDAIQASKRQKTKDEHDKVLLEVGLTEESPLCRLFHLYGFDISFNI